MESYTLFLLAILTLAAIVSIIPLVTVLGDRIPERWAVRLFNFAMLAATLSICAIPLLAGLL